MINVIYLVLVTYSNNGVSTEKIMQANQQQCQINAAFYNKQEHKAVSGGAVKYKAYCTAGVK